MIRLLLFLAFVSFAFPGSKTVYARETPAEPLAGDTGDPVSNSYWLRNREGWFWYRDPPLPAPKSPLPPAASRRPPELARFEAMQKRLDELKRVAVMNPTETNLLAYMRYQRMVMNKSEVFAEHWQRLVWTVPELDYGLTGRPTNSMAIAAFDEDQRERQAQAIRGLSATHGLLFIFRSDCPYCHRFAPILKRFEQEFGMLVFPVSLDGGGLPEYPNPQPDNGIAARLNASVVPALYLTAPSKREIRPVGFGLMALSDLIERIAALAQDQSNNPL
ncbi:MAG: conjugal transfer protein TraF [Burkholderiales bacterium]|nr:conjugal transfer protein TraF [Burkholderiales bacterium]